MKSKLPVVSKPPVWFRAVLRLERTGMQTNGGTNGCEVSMIGFPLVHKTLVSAVVFVTVIIIKHSNLI